MQTWHIFFAADQLQVEGDVENVSDGDGELVACEIQWIPADMQPDLQVWLASSFSLLPIMTIGQLFDHYYHYMGDVCSTEQAVRKKRGKKKKRSS